MATRKKGTTLKERSKKVAPSKMALGVSDGFRAYVLDQLADLGEVTPRSMFGGIGLHRGELFFGLIARDVLYLKVDDRTRGDYEAAGMSGFQPYPDREKMSTNYYEVPIAVLESADTLTQWARRAVDVAKRAGAAKTTKTARTTKTTRTKKATRATKTANATRRGRSSRS